MTNRYTGDYLFQPSADGMRLVSQLTITIRINCC